MIFDTHAHYDDDVFHEDRDKLLMQLHQNGIANIVNIGAALQGCKDTLMLTRQYPFIFGAVGIHPDEVKDMNEQVFLWLEEAAKDPKILAIGEIGLDYHWDASPRNLQAYWFRRQLQLALSCKKPVVIHSRDAAQDTMDILSEWHESYVNEYKEEQLSPGVIHCYGYSLEFARMFIKMGFYIGIGGVVTFKNAHKIKDVVKEIPLERIVLETDAPYLAPVPIRGSRNHSGNLKYVVKEIATLKGMSSDEVERVTFENARTLYRMV